MFAFLKKPYPYYYTRKRLPVLAVLLFALAFAFVFFFRPFNVYYPEHRHNYVLISMLQAALPVLVFFCFFSVLNLFFRDASIRNRWKLGNEILAIALVLPLMGTANFLIRDLIYDNPENWSLPYLLEEIRNTALVAVLLIFLLVPLNMRRLELKFKSRSAGLNQMIDQRTLSGPSSEPVQINTLVKNDDFELHSGELLFVRSSGNYSEFFTKSDKDQDARKSLKRIPLKQVEEQLDPIREVLRVHRSYLVNARKIIKVSGNAQGLQISLEGCDEKVPVSRGYLEGFRKALREHSESTA
jgi:hypothetical protein